MDSILEKIKAAKDLSEIIIEVKEWGVSFLLIEPPRGIILKLKEKYELKADAKGAIVSGDLDGFTLACFAEMAHDPDTREKVFKDVNQAQQVIGKKSSKTYAKVLEATTALVSEPDSESIEEAEGNSEGMQS